MLSSSPKRTEPATSEAPYGDSMGSPGGRLRDANGLVVGQWSTGLCSCFESVVPNCLWAFCCPTAIVSGVLMCTSFGGLLVLLKAHPLSINELSILMNSFGDLHPFLGAMFRFLFSVSYLGCFRISEVLGLKWCDVSRAVSENGPYVSVRLRWHKKASVEKECQVYNLVDEISYPCLRVCGFHEEYVSSVTATITHVTDNAFVFPQ
ncbi:hypothetical protein AeRB84_009419 [Aphanomyces euteiches]|nr:hypothetical protein AeRB84_009419 [Aphanomyces euteiches]